MSWSDSETTECFGFKARGTVSPGVIMLLLHPTNPVLWEDTVAAGWRLNMVWGIAGCCVAVLPCVVVVLCCVGVVVQLVVVIVVFLGM